MKILHILPSLNTSLGGGLVEAAIQLCQELQNQGVEITLATTQLGDYKNFSIPVYCFSRRFNSFLPAQFAFSPAFKNWLKRHIKGFDLLHTHSLFSYPSTIAADYARRYGIPYIIRPAGMLSPACLKKSAFKKKVYTLLFEKRNLKNAAAIHFTTEEEMHSAKRFKLDNKQIVIPNGLNLRIFKDVDSLGGAFRKRYPQSTGKKIILFLSRLHPLKGLDLLIPALKIISQQREDFIFVIAGRGEGGFEKKVRGALGGSRLKRLAILIGFIEEKEKLALLADADIFVLPSYHENFSMATVEAMASGLPVIISRHVNIHRLIEDYGAGIVTELNTQDIASALERLLEDERLRQAMGGHGRQLVQDNFDIKEVVRKMQQIYSDLIHK